MNLPRLLLAFVVISLSCEITLEFGPTGHCLVAILGYHWASEYTRTILDRLFPNMSSLCNAANWPDSVKGTPEYRHTASDHFMSDWENEKSLEGKCPLIPINEISCPKGHCIIQALQRISNELSLEFEQNLPHIEISLFMPLLKTSDLAYTKRFKDAISFVIHYIGDAHQPLHLCGRLKGGNEQTVSYNRKQTDLHSLWDTQFLESKINQEHQGSFESYALELLAQENIKRTNTDSSPPLSLEWFARWASVIHCKYAPIVWKDIIKNGHTYDLAGTAYEETAFMVLDDLLIAAGHKLAVLLDEIFRLK